MFLDRPLFAKSLIAQVLIQLAPEILADPHAKPHATEAGEDQQEYAMGWHGLQDICRRFVLAPDAEYSSVRPVAATRDAYGRFQIPASDMPG